MATGFEQARSVVAAIAGDQEAADRVELDLPETGVCSVGAAAEASSGNGCCATAAQPAPAATKAAASCGTSLCGPKAKELAVAPVRCCS
jgi:hypothetical protein